jgi:hypothetical protein
MEKFLIYHHPALSALPGPGSVLLASGTSALKIYILLMDFQGAFYVIRCKKFTLGKSLTTSE